MSTEGVMTYLSKIEFPATKQDIINAVKKTNAPAEIVSAANGLPNREYASADEVAEEMGER